VEVKFARKHITERRSGSADSKAKANPVIIAETAVGRDSESAVGESVAHFRAPLARSGCDGLLTTD